MGGQRGGGSNLTGGHSPPPMPPPRWSRHWLFDVEYYRDLEMPVRDHSRSLKVVPFESLGMVSYSPSIVTMAIQGCILYRLQNIATYW